MNLKQLRMLQEIARQSFNLSAASVALNTSQPGVSRQIQLLEGELGVDLLVRQKNRILGLTDVGRVILKSAEKMLQEANTIFAVAAESRHGGGRLILATSHLHARYTLRKSLKLFCDRHQEVQLRLVQADPDAIPKLVENGDADIGISTAYENAPAGQRLLSLDGDLVKRSVIMPRDHPLAKSTKLTLEDLAGYPIVGYSPTSRAGLLMTEACSERQIALHFIVSASDCDVVKTYVREGLGIGIVPSISLDPGDKRIRAIDVSHLLRRTVTRINIRRDIYLRQYLVDFIGTVSPRWDRHAIRVAIES